MQKKLLLLSFIEGAAVMAAELCGAKLLAPVFGSSLYVWASVMGVTLAALASGYFFGGWLSGRSGKHATHLFHILNAAALLILVTPVLNYYLVPRISYLPYLPGIVLSTLALLFLPVFFLGASSPLFILIQTDQANAAGKVSGSIYAISTAGGILATFVCGFYFIPELGLNACLVIFGTALFLCNVLVLKVFKSFHFFLVIAFAYLNFQFVFKTVFSEGSSDSILGHLEIKDLADQNKRPYRVLLVNDVVQSEMDLVTKKSISAYVHIIDTLVKRSSLQKQALVLGLGAGLTANLLNEKTIEQRELTWIKGLLMPQSGIFISMRK